VLVTEIQTAQALEFKESFDPTDVGSLDPRHKGEDDGEWGYVSPDNRFSGFVSKRMRSMLRRQAMAFSMNRLSGSG
jgi:hypothetical protein